MGSKALKGLYLTYRIYRIHTLEYTQCFLITSLKLFNYLFIYFYLFFLSIKQFYQTDWLVWLIYISLVWFIGSGSNHICGLAGRSCPSSPVSPQHLCVLWYKLYLFVCLSVYLIKTLTMACYPTINVGIR